MSDTALIESIPSSAFNETVQDSARAFVPSHGYGTLAPFKRGSSPNPGGRGKPYFEALAIAKQNSPEAMRKLVSLMDSDDDRVVLIACNSILDRVLGKPKEIKEDNQAVMPALTSLSQAQLAALKDIMSKLAGQDEPQPASTAEATEASRPIDTSSVSDTASSGDV